MASSLAALSAINAAMCPAPNPLSMFTTATPGAHPFNIDKSGVMPPRLEPYPTLVGTPITGALTKPAITDGNAPSIPAIATITVAACNVGKAAKSLCMPATPISKTSSALHPIREAVIVASRAIGMSDVPAVVMTTPGTLGVPFLRSIVIARAVES